MRYIQKLSAHPWIRWASTALLLLVIAALLALFFAWQIPLAARIQLNAGDVAPYDVTSPSKITYESPILTEQARDRAAQAVPEQYDSPEGRIRRQQIKRSADILEFITIVRNDPYASPALKTDYLLAISDLALSPEAALEILNLSESEWEQVAAEVPQALDRAMRDEIRESNLPSIRRRVSALISADLDEVTSAVTANLVRSLIRPNSLLNTEQSEALRAKAREEIPIQMETIEAGEVIVRAGDVVTPEDVEAMEQVGLLQSTWNWWFLVRAALLAAIVLALVIGALWRLRPATLSNSQELAIVVSTTVIWLVAAKFMIIPHDWVPYLYPMAAFSILLAVLIDLRVSLIFTIAFVFVINFMGSHSTALATYMGAGALLGALTLGRAERLTAFLWVAVVIAVSNLFVLGAYDAPFTEFSTAALIQTGLVAILNGGLSASIALIAYFIIGNIFGIATSLQLTELSRPTHPLLRQLLLKSSGTYHHTIVVSNLAERAAAAIGADAYLARVGAYYHDIGKTVRPYFFSENIADGSSPHDKLDPHTSAQIIISHVKDGLDLAEKYHLPPRIRDFIREHHGSSLVKYFYHQALQEAQNGETVDEADFRYPGPSPRSKETAILLLADTCEAAVRAVKPATREELTALVSNLIDERVSDGELDESNLTFRELQTTKDVFLRVLEGVHHPRITYPDQVSKAAPAETAAAQTQHAAGAAAPTRDAVEAVPARLTPPGGVERMAEGGRDDGLNVQVEINS